MYSNQKVEEFIKEHGFAPAVHAAINQVDSLRYYLGSIYNQMLKWYTYDVYQKTFITYFDPIEVYGITGDLFLKELYDRGVSSVPELHRETAPLGNWILQVNHMTEIYGKLYFGKNDKLIQKFIDEWKTKPPGEHHFFVLWEHFVNTRIQKDPEFMSLIKEHIVKFLKDIIDYEEFIKGTTNPHDIGCITDNISLQAMFLENIIYRYFIQLQKDWES